MPYVHGYSEKSIHRNIALFRREGREAASSVRAAFEVARKEWRKRHPRKAYPGYLRGPNGTSQTRGRRSNNMATWADYQVGSTVLVEEMGEQRKYKVTDVYPGGWHGTAVGRYRGMRGGGANAQITRVIQRVPTIKVKDTPRGFIVTIGRRSHLRFRTRSGAEEVAAAIRTGDRNVWENTMRRVFDREKNA